MSHKRYNLPGVTYPEQSGAGPHTPKEEPTPSTDRWAAAGLASDVIAAIRLPASSAQTEEILQALRFVHSKDLTIRLRSDRIELINQA